MIRSFCSPSQLSRCFHCPGSVRLLRSTDFGDKKNTSPAAERGTLLHDAVEQFVKIGEESLVKLSAGDARAVRFCGMWIDANAPGGTFEIQTDLSRIGIEAGEKGNRIDYLTVSATERTGVLVDFKFGEFEVPAPRYNLQLKAYAYGVMKAFGLTAISAYILQPELEDTNRVKFHLFTVTEMEEIGTELAKIVADTKAPDAPLVSGGWCGFCMAKDVCPNHRGLVLGMPSHMSVPMYLKQVAPAERGELYDQLKRLASWCKAAIGAIEEFAIDEHGEIAGYEIAPGRSTRSWRDPEVTMSKLRVIAVDAAVPITEFIAPEHPQSVAVVEKLMGKKLFAQELGDQVSVELGADSLKRKEGARGEQEE